MIRGVHILGSVQRREREEEKRGGKILCHFYLIYFQIDGESIMILNYSKEWIYTIPCPGFACFFVSASHDMAGLLKSFGTQW